MPAGDAGLEQGSVTLLPDTYSAMQAVVDAAREVVASSPSWGWIRENGGVMPGTERLNMTVTLGPFAQLADALDKVQVAQPEGEQAR